MAYFASVIGAAAPSPSGGSETDWTGVIAGGLLLAALILYGWFASRRGTRTTSSHRLPQRRHERKAA
jgi:hypothetical protein